MINYLTTAALKMMAYAPGPALGGGGNGAGLSPGQGTNPVGPVGVNGLPAPISQIGQIQSLACTAINWMFWMLLILAVIFILVSAYGYVVSGGDPERVHNANRTLIFASVAVVVALFAGGLPALIGSLFGTYGIAGCSAFGGLLGAIGL